MLAANAFILTQLGWAALAFEEGGGRMWDSAAAAIAVAPFVALCAAAWTAVYWADRVLRAALLEHAGALGAAALLARRTRRPCVRR